MQFLTSILITLILFINTAYAFEAEKCQPLEEKVCVDYSEKMIEGFPVSWCWKYEQRHKCVGREQNYCQVLEDNRGCNEISGKCIEESGIGICKHFEKKFVCGNTFEEKEDTKLIDSEFNVLRDEKDISNCSKEELNKYCEILSETCIEGAETRNINGKDVFKECWKWDRRYVCRSDSFVDECGELKERCKELSKECLHYSSNGRCEHYELKYQCSEQVTKNVDCLATKFCIGGVCETKKRNQFNDFGYAISHLSILAQMKSNEMEGCKCPEGRKECEPSEIQPKDCKLFKGDRGICRRVTSQFNCCSMKGFLRNIAKCSQKEKDLRKLRIAGRCHHVGSWKELKGLKKKESHCCFKSKLARIIQVEGRKQLGIGWGDRKNPDCRALTLEEIQRIDFSRIDFGELFDEIVEKAKLQADSQKGGMADKVKGFQSNPSAMSELINKKIVGFYEHAKN
ncbi:hypothetical protein NF27_IP00080 [Candidatus Jidaibacter acanthamoeba]|uniref:Conjugal transfer mating pair stabilization protein TraN n=1 Tax=Candidatus Jidaibacter acanthamoebae TaxID=86105 RepID=A0A0C1QW66_9RICK|nr:conjugal transfer protein TraN [Candidatus Jidaibacter acanthamoeba]KIE04240.1 hypothetical protein NF27_IP00080 [Candidatus Jidaibacter acanthamoeba]